MTAEQLVGVGYYWHLDTGAAWEHTELSTLMNTCIISRERAYGAAFRLCFDPGAEPVGVVRCSLFTVADTEATPANAAGLNHVRGDTYLLLSPVWKYQTTVPPHFSKSGYDAWRRFSLEGTAETIPMCQHLFDW